MWRCRSTGLASGRGLRAVARARKGKGFAELLAFKQCVGPAGRRPRAVRPRARTRPPAPPYPRRR